MALPCIPRGGRLVVGDGPAGDRNSAGVKVDIDAAAVAVGASAAAAGCVELSAGDVDVGRAGRVFASADARAAILAVSETSVRVSLSVSPLLFSIISMKWLWDGAYASGIAVGILILLVAFFVFEPRTAPSQK